MLYFFVIKTILNQVVITKQVIIRNNKFAVIKEPKTIHFDLPQVRNMKQQSDA